MRRFAFLIALSVTAASAADDPLAPLEQTARKKTADWEILARGLESKIARLLPCDPRTRSAIEDVSRASDVRMAALSDYLKAAAEQARGDADAAKRALTGLEVSMRDSTAERAEADQERVAVEGQLADLVDSAHRRAKLGEAQQKLEAIAAMMRDRATAAQLQVDRKNALAAALRDIVRAYEARRDAADAAVTALAAESSRWSDYYAARLARAQTECTITNQGAATPPQRKKQ